MEAPARHHVQLLVSEWCAPCRGAEEAWQQVADARDIVFEVLDMAQPEARSVAQRLSLRTVPAVVIDGQLAAVGVQPLQRCLELVADAPARQETVQRFIGMTLTGPSRAALLAAAAYLLLAGLPLLLGDAGGRATALFPHLFALGFVGFIVYGLAEHMLPRFMSRPVRMGGLMWLQHLSAHTGVVLLAGGFLMDSRAAQAAGSAATWLALCAFALRLLPVLFSRGEDGAG